ncbi:DMT family transporter [Planctomycetota bacterium]|nr:DMT family transporter [Planctomycetota bacterium]
MNESLQPDPANRRKATLALLSVCIFWGATFSWINAGTDAIKSHYGADHVIASGTFFVLARMIVGAVLMPIVIPASIKRMDRRAVKMGFLLSLPFGAGFILQNVGLAYPDLLPAQSAFLTSIYVVATPILSAIIFRKRPAFGVLVGVLLATLGAAFIKGPPDGGLGVGAWMTIASAVMFGGHILITDWGTKRADPMAITLSMILWTMLWSLLVMAFTPDALGLFAPDVLGAILQDSKFLINIFLCGLLATTIAISVLNRWQKELTPTRAAIIYTAEPVFASLYSMFVSGQDVFSWWLVFGAAMILLANLSAEFLRKRGGQPS